MKNNLFPIFSKWTLIFTLVVTFAGGFVRMTGSGMGCPDWPKCFGHFIPPTEASELEFQENTEYDARQMIIVNEALWRAKESFVSGKELDLNNWEKYTKHDYTKFNVAHTWTEYVNRLAGALLGIFSMIMLVGAIIEKDSSRLKILLSLLVVFLVAFEAWLGMKVVESVLKPVIISLHMIGAFFILGLIIWMRAKYTSGAALQFERPKGIYAWLWVVMILSVVQILMGTQVREGLSIVSKTFSDRGEWFDLLKGETWMSSNISMLVMFYFHRSFSIIVFLTNYMVYRKLQPQFRFTRIRRMNNWIFITLLVEIVTGAVMYYVDVPGLMQLVHLVFASFLFAEQFYLFSIVRRK
jgi:cytochrome c oxidase assembly protein subunit 15